RPCGDRARSRRRRDSFQRPDL
ncbi:MAG: hypothetical protein AVDCRST_MAG93-8731, partial [uncultured Chloroflexia bacterium]